MTNKQAIIDDIDVNGCIHYKATGKYNTCGYYCEQNSNCYYKQLKRKEIILNNIKEYVERYLGSADRYYILKMMGEI